LLQRSRYLLLDNDDDGESAAGGRLAHLLQILVSHPLLCLIVLLEYYLQDVKDVLVVVTRYFGGTLLGADRFKHINQAARDALELGGFIETKRVAAESRARSTKG
jgi:putative IMPACT (imprinted ancient) family translation regulator